jgi:hypothetical protein
VEGARARVCMRACNGKKDAIMRPRKGIVTVKRRMLSEFRIQNELHSVPKASELNTQGTRKNTRAHQSDNVRAAEHHHGAMRERYAVSIQELETRLGRARNVGPLEGRR